MQFPDYRKDGSDQLVVNTFKNYLASDACIQINLILDLNIQEIMNKIIDGSYQDSDELNRMRAQIVAYRELKKLPHDVINRMSLVDQSSNSADPYDTIETMRKK
jgi:hypothetical protein